MTDVHEPLVTPSFGDHAGRPSSPRRGAGLGVPRGRDTATNAWFAEFGRVEEEGERAFDRVRVPLFERSQRPHVFSADERKRMDTYESIDYAEPQSLLYKTKLLEKNTERRWVKWVVYVAVGIAVGFWATLLFQTLDFVSDLKKRAFDNTILAHNDAAGARSPGGVPFRALWTGYAVFICWSVTAAAISSLLCVLMPSAAGSGVPDVMAYLNGVMFPRIFNIRNLVVKTLSCIFAVNSGLPCGAEGPMIHIGALIGAGLPTGRSRSLKCSATTLLSTFRNPKDQRDFITAGSACGVTSAFSSPIGGLLFVMEEMATFFPTKLAWMVFVSCLACMVTMQLCNSYLAGWEPRERTGEAWGNFVDQAITLFKVDWAGQRMPMNLKTFIPTVVVAIFMAGHAIVYILASLKVARLRAKKIFPRTLLRVSEPAVFILFYATACFVLPMAFECEPVPEYIVQNAEKLEIRLVTSFCENNGRRPGVTGDAGASSSSTSDSSNSQTEMFHPLATLTLTNSYNAIRCLFARHTHGMFPWHATLIYLALYSSGAVWTGGMFISCGVVIPTILIGALGGRLTGVLFDQPTWADSGVVAMIGAASFFGGLSRLTFSLIVIMMEITNDLSHITCLMLGIIISKTIADKFCHSLYHVILEVKCVPFLAVQTAVHKYDTFCAKDIMATPVVCVSPHETVGRLMDLLATTKHNCFPVVGFAGGAVAASSPGESPSGVYRGTLQRSQIQHIIWFLHLHTEPPVTVTATATVAPTRSGGYGGVSVPTGRINGSTDSTPRVPTGPSSDHTAAAAAAGHGDDGPPLPTATYDELKQVQETIFWDRLPAVPAQISPSLASRVVNLAPYMDTSAPYVRDVMCVSRTYYTFRILGLRHLPVLDRHNNVIGMITRKNLVGDRLVERLELAQKTAQEASRGRRRRM